MKHTNDVTTAKNHTHVTVVFITNGKNLYDKAYTGGNNFCSLMKPHLLSGITVTATLTFKWFF